MESGISTILEAINTYGTAFILAAIVIFFLIKWLKYEFNHKENRAKLQDELEKGRQAQYDKLQDMMSAVLEEKLGIDIESCKESDHISDEIDLRLESVLEKTRADRAYVFLFHNGGKDMTGRHFPKMSCTNEKVQVGIKPSMQNFQNLYRSSLIYKITCLKESGICWIDDVDDIKERDYATYDMMVQNGVQSSYSVAVCLEEGYPCGFLGIDFLRKAPLRLEEIKQILQSESLKIDGLLCLRKNWGRRA